MKRKMIGIILAGGRGLRFGADKPKQECMICGNEMVWYSIKAFHQSKNIDDFVVVVNDEEYKNQSFQKNYQINVVQGGNTLNESKWEGLKWVNDHYPDADCVLIHSSACPLITAQIIDDMFSAYESCDGIQCAYKIRDALSSDVFSNVNRDDFYLIQSPEIFNFKLLFHSFDKKSENCNTAVHCPPGSVLKKYWDFSPNLKVTYPEDILIIEAIMKHKK